MEALLNQTLETLACDDVTAVQENPAVAVDNENDDEDTEKNSQMPTIIGVFCRAMLVETARPHSANHDGG